MLSNKCNGAATNINGAGRNAHNNTIFAYAHDVLIIGRGPTF